METKPFTVMLDKELELGHSDFLSAAKQYKRRCERRIAGWNSRLAHPHVIWIRDNTTGREVK